MTVRPSPLGNRVRGPLNALFFSVFDGYINRLLYQRKTELFADLPSSIVELGAGVGANFAYLQKGSHVTAVEPNPHMHEKLRKRAGKFDIALDIVPCGAESIALPDDSADAVIATLVLCTLADPARALLEVRRILKPGGRFLFLEHVAAPEGHWRRRLQEYIHRPWHYVFEGCNTNRDTAALLDAAGFRELSIVPYTMNGPFVPVNTQIFGVASV